MSCGSNTSTASQSALPSFENAYSGLLGVAQNVAQTPYQQYSGNLVAPLSQNQQDATGATSGFGSQATNDFNAATPQLQQAYNFLQSSTSPLWSGVQQFSPQAVSQYES